MYIIVQALLSKHAASLLLLQQQQQQQQQQRQQSTQIATNQSSSSTSSTPMTSSIAAGGEGGSKDTSGTTNSSSQISIHDGSRETRGVALAEDSIQSDLIMTTPDRHTLPATNSGSSGNSNGNRLATPIRTPVPFSFASHNLRVIGPSHTYITQRQQQLHQYTAATSTNAAHSSHPAAPPSTDLIPLRNLNPPTGTDVKEQHTEEGKVVVDLRDDDDEDNLAVSTHVDTSTAFAPLPPSTDFIDSSSEMHIAQSQHLHHDVDDSSSNSRTGSECGEEGDGDGESVGKRRKRSYSNVYDSFPLPSASTSNEHTSQIPNKRVSARLTSRTAPDEPQQQQQERGQGRDQQSEEDEGDNNDNNNVTNVHNNSSSSSGRVATKIKEPLTPTRFLSNHGRKFKTDDHVSPRIGSAYQADLPPLNTCSNAPTTTTHNHTISSSSSSSAMVVDTSALDLEVPKADPEKDGLVWDPSRLGRSADRLIGTYLLAAEECINDLRNEIRNHSTTGTNKNSNNTSSSSSSSSSNSSNNNSNIGTVGHMFSTGSSLLVTRTATEDVLLKLLHDRYTLLY